MLKIYVKNQDFQILHTFTQTPLKLFKYQSYQYNYRVNHWLSYDIRYILSLGK